MKGEVIDLFSRKTPVSRNTLGSVDIHEQSDVEKRERARFQWLEAHLSSLVDRTPIQIGRTVTTLRPDNEFQIFLVMSENPKGTFLVQRPLKQAGRFPGPTELLFQASDLIDSADFARVNQEAYRLFPIDEAEREEDRQMIIEANLRPRVTRKGRRG